MNEILEQSEGTFFMKLHKKVVKKKKKEKAEEVVSILT
jgi:hypothetical protein